MKKSIIMIAILGCAVLPSCGIGATGNTSATPATAPTAAPEADLSGVISNVIGSLTSSAATNASAIVGTWNYSGPCVQFESDNFLAKAGGSVVSAKAESTLGSYYQKVGLKPGTCSFVFGSDKSLKIIMGGKSYTGTYTFNSSNNTVTMTGQFGSNLTAYVTISGSSMGLTFDSTKLITILSKVSAMSQKTSAISTIANQYKGMKLGFKFKK